MPTSRYALSFAAITAGLVACGGAEPPPMRSPASQPAPPVPVVTATAAQASVAQMFADDEPEMVFTDPDRRKKIESAFSSIDALLDEEVRAQSFPGIALGVVIDGELAYAKGFGVTDLVTKAKPDADTVYRIGSITKSFTALAVLALRDEGALGLDDPLTRFLPEAGGLVYPTRDTPSITLRQLLTQTSGLPRLGSFDYTRPDRELSEEEVLKSLASFPLENAPGSSFVYSNLGFGLLGIAVGRASHTSLRAVVGKKIFEPLGMTSSGWDPAGVPAGRIATPYKRGASGALEPTATWRLGASEGAGGIYSSLRDMGRYVAFQLAAYPPRNAPAPGSIRRSSVREAHFNARRSGRLSVELREAPAKGEDLVTASSASYGYGWRSEETCTFNEIIRHSGAVAGFAASVSFLPESGVGVVALTNFFEDAFRFEPLIDSVLLALAKSGGLSKRVHQRHGQLAPAFALAMAQFIAVENAWDGEAYKAMLSKSEEFVDGGREELATYRSLHGACTGYTPLEIFTPFRARLAMQCERGTLEMVINLDPTDGLIKGFTGTSIDAKPSPELTKVANRLAGLIGKWNDDVYRKHLAPKAKKPRADIAAFFERIRKQHGACEVKAFKQWGGQHQFSLGCERGGGATLVLGLDEKNPDAVTSYTITPEAAGACPVK
ncbi:MAG: serine hydrolase domain-containing protein [Byssovorax sp.]